MLLAIVGLNGSGKDTVANYLMDNFGFAHKSFSKLIRSEALCNGLKSDERKVLVSFANNMRRAAGAGYWAKKILLDYDGASNLVLTSIRNPAEVREIKLRGGIIVEVYAGAKKRFERASKRGQYAGDLKMTFNDFKEAEQRELKSSDPSKQQLAACISLADYRLNNNGSQKDLEKKINSLLKKLAKKK
ncbi:MAG: AAA family ATPase [archaeon]|jgi:dephospho-CoA kinase